MERERGFTLIELLIVVAIIGVLAAIAIPNLMNAMSRAKQKRTMSDIRSVGIAWEARATDRSDYAAAGLSICCSEVLSASTIQGMLVPTYLKDMIAKDGWTRPLEFAINDDASGYMVTSYGRDGEKENAPAGGATDDFDCDIIYSHGMFIQYPEGVQGE